MAQTIILRLSVEQAVIVHSLCSAEFVSMEAMARYTQALPLASQMFIDVARSCGSVVSQINEQMPETAEESRIRERRAAASE